MPSERPAGLVGAAVADELRRVLGLIAFREVEVSVRYGGTAVIELGLGDAATLADVLGTAARTPSRMTLRVGTVESGGEPAYGRQRVVEVVPDAGLLRDDVFRMPPCECPRHRPDLHAGRAAVRTLRDGGAGGA